MVERERRAFGERSLHPGVVRTVVTVGLGAAWFCWLIRL